MSKTMTEIATSVLKKLGRLPDGQTATTSQVKTISDEYDGLYAELLNDSLVDWSSTDDIPDYASSMIKVLLLGMVADDFGVPNTWTVLTDLQRFKLSQQISNPYVAEETEFEDF